MFLLQVFTLVGKVGRQNIDMVWFVFSVGNLYPEVNNATLEMDGRYSATFLSIKHPFFSFFTADTKTFT